ncbi:MAG: hypothetical protein ABIK09_08030 [Pseudomonadota bacterium]
MKTRALCMLSLLAILFAGCSTDPAGNTPGIDTTTDDGSTDCAGDDCGGGGEVDIVVDCGTQCPDEVEPDAAVCENKCELGQVTCTTDTRYKACGKVDGSDCLDFVGATVFCPTKTECVCIDLGEEWCTPEGDPCVCIPECEGKVCGADGCGGKCGVCGEGFICNQDDGTCIEGNPDETCDECVLTCGEDGSGPNCCLEDEQKCNGVKIVTCADAYPDDDACVCWKWPEDVEGEDCEDPLQICQDLPDDLGVCLCEFLTCDTGCCPTAAFSTCDSQGACCVPDCGGGKECGDDGCGGKCGLCPEGNVCFTDIGKCSSECVDECVNAGDTKCQGAFAFKTCVETQLNDQSCLIWDAEYTYCPAQNVCAAGACVCQPNCMGKNCGPDGCGGDCGSCVSPNTCNAGACECICVDVWQPVCDEASCETYPNWCEAACAGINDYNQGPCDCGCTSECTEEEWLQGPICGVDGVDYASFCELKCADDNYGNNCPTELDCDEIDHFGVCNPEVVYCAGTGCPVDYNPVCGSKNKTYWNYCCFDLTAPDDDEYFCQGECVAPGACPDAAMICSPVCGLDGGQQVSYFNAQFRDCLGGIPAYDAACCDSVSLWEDWVCVDNVGTLEAFLNDSVMTCTDPSLLTLYPIPTDAYGDWQVAVCDDCQCDLSETDESTWLCGSNFNTYQDQCALNCFADGNPALSSVPKCDSGCGFMTDECPCPPGIGGAAGTDTPTAGTADTGARGVCGDDGYTYGSLCDATYNGVMVVEDIWCAECEDLCKGEDYGPLCCKLPGQDTGATYPNGCVVTNCSDIYETGDCFSGECCLEDGDCNDGNAATADSCDPLTFVCDHI